ncbi:MAG: hypothetical protein ACRD9Q_07260 [Nitrososphaeraceae archaeon]
MTETSELIEKIKSRGYWQIELRPLIFKKDRLSVADCKKVVEKCQVRLRGWYYPHIGYEAGDVFSGDNFEQGYVEWKEHCEIWRMYRSGQFIHDFSFWEDRLEYEPYGYNVRLSNGSIRHDVMNIIMTLYTVTEIFLFASRLASNSLFDKTLHVSIKLKNTNNRLLIFSDPTRMLHGTYMCKINEINIERDVSTEDIIANFATLAMDVVVEIFEKFNWHSPDIRNVLKSDQEKLLKGLL